MEKEIVNCSVLQDFIAKNKLRDRNSNVHFNSIVSITTAKNEMIELPTEVRISFGGYDNPGTLTLMDNSIDNSIFPSEFLAKWQNFKIDTEANLVIFDVHKMNPIIGKYEVKITPLNRLKD